MNRSTFLGLCPAILGFQMCVRGWDLGKVDPLFPLIFCGLLAAAFLTVPNILNLGARLSGASKPWVGQEMNDAEEKPASEWIGWVWPLAILGLGLTVSLREVAGGWPAVATMTATWAFALGLTYIVERFGLGFFSGGWLFPRTKNELAKTGGEQ